MRSVIRSRGWVVAAAVGLVAGFLARGLCQGPARAGGPAPAASGIAALHERDRAATLSGDARALSDLWTEDAVRMEPSGAAEVGRAAIVAEDAREQAPRPKGRGFLRYQPDIRGVSVHGDWAVEWGYFDSLWRRSAKAEPTTMRGKLLRVLHREGDGKWRFARVMWNAAS